MTSSNAAIIEHVLTEAKKQGADKADCIFLNTMDVSVSCRKGKQEQLERSESSGIGLRVWVGDAPAMASTSDCSPASLMLLAERALSMARVATDDTYADLADSSCIIKNIPDLDLYDSNEPEVNLMFDRAKQCEAVALETKGITNSEGADASYGTYELIIATSAGCHAHYRASMQSLSVSVLAGKGAEMERDYDYSTARHFGDLLSPKDIGKGAAQKALARLHPRKKATTQIPVIFDPRVGRSLLGAFSSGINGTSIARGTSFLKDQMHKEIFNQNVCIVDDATRRRGLGSKPFDGEGLATAPLTLVENGVLQTWLLDTRSANQLGLKSTGHASRGMASPPSPSSTNLYMKAGKISVNDLIADIKEGFYVTEAFGMGVNTVTGDYSQGASGFWIENGEIVYPVSEMTIAGKMLDMFVHLIPANDLVFKYATNTPTLRVEGMTVAGS